MGMGMPGTIMAGTKSTTQNNRKSRLQRNGFSLVGLELLLAAGILWLAVPRTITAFYLIPGNPVLKKLQEMKDVGADDLLSLAKSRRQAIEWLPTGRAFTDLGLAKLEMSRATGFSSEEGNRLLHEATMALTQGLDRSPANPYAWARYAYTKYITNHGANAESAAAIRNSILAGPLEWRLMLNRIEMSFANWAFFDPEGRKLAEGQLRRAWDREWNYSWANEAWRERTQKAWRRKITDTAKAQNAAKILDSVVNP